MCQFRAFIERRIHVALYAPQASSQHEVEELNRRLRNALAAGEAAGHAAASEQLARLDIDKRRQVTQQACATRADTLGVVLHHLWIHLACFVK